MFAMVVFMATLTCCCCGGGTATVVVAKQLTAPSVSVGDELLKLQEAKDEGILTDEEFEAAKQKLLEGE